MGNFYVSFTVRGTDPALVAGHLAKRRRKAFVSPPRNGFVTFYDEKCDQQDVDDIDKLGSRISKDLDTSILAVMNHDDDVLMYWLFDSGELADQYNSCPDFFDDEMDLDAGDAPALPSGGDVALLARALGSQADGAALEAILRSPNFEADDPYLFAVDRHKALVEALSLPADYGVLGFTYVKHGDAVAVPHRDAFIEVRSA